MTNLDERINGSVCVKKLHPRVESSFGFHLFFARCKPEKGGHGHDFGHELVSESVSEADSHTNFFETSDTGKGMTSDSDLGSDMRMSENLGHEFGLGQLSNTRVRPSLVQTVRIVRTSNSSYF